MTTTADTAELLRQYFIQQQSVNLPGIGGFEMNRVPAHVDHHSGTIHAPSYTIRYDSLNDIPSKEMFAHIARKKDITEWEAIGVVNHFSMELKDQLKKGHRFDWAGMGSLENNDAGQLIFEPYSIRYPFHADIYVATKWQKYDDPESSGQHYVVPDADASDEVVIEARASWWISAAVVAAAALLLIFFSLIRSEYKLSSARETKLTPSVPPSQFEFKPAE